MANYINREAMLEQIAKREPLMVDNKMISIDALRTFIINRPIADVEEVKHGHWTHIVGYDPRDAWDECSRCRTTVKYPGTRYCPNCGAKNG